MAVKRSRSALRTLTVLEGVAANQPVGVSALARALGDDKSAIQRALMTLADDGWIRPATGATGRWELTPRLLAVSRLPDSSQKLRHRAREVLEWLRDATHETVFLTIPDGSRFVIIEALESAHLLRMVPPIGMTVPIRGSATARAVLPFHTPERQAQLLGGPPDAETAAQFEETRAHGYAVSVGEIEPSSVAFAAPVFAGGQPEPVASIVVAGPRERITPDRHAGIGGLVADAARRLSTD